MVFGSDERPLGQLFRADRRIYFEFDPSFLAAPLPLSPRHLPVQSGLHQEQKYTFAGLFGVFDDSLPDGWGRLLLDRALAQRGLDRREFGPLDRLAAVGEEGAGALVYRPVWEVAAPPSVVELQRLFKESQQILAGDEETVLPELLALGGSSGGARPKVLVGYDPQEGRLIAGHPSLPLSFLPTLVKFPMRQDRPDMGAAELAYSRMARAAGIDMMPTWLLGATREHPGFFATQRFDRPRTHVHSVCGLLHADYRVPCLDYEDLLRTIRWLTRDQRAVEQGFRRMVFNVLAHNRDDHSRNTAFLMDADGTWTLAPAFDLSFSQGPNGEHWMTVAGEGRNPQPHHLEQLAKKAGVMGSKVILEEVREAIRDWPRFAKDAGVGVVTRREIEARILRG